MKVVTMKVVRGALALLLLLVTPAASMGKPPAWTPLFNGVDLEGWQHVGPGHFWVDKGIMRTEGGMGLLWYQERKIGRAVLRVVYKTLTRTANSGVFIRIPLPPEEAVMPVNRGYEVQIDDSRDDYHVTGALYSLTKARAHPGRIGQWNTMEIRLDGPRTVVTINGVLVTDYREGQPVPPKRLPHESDRGPRPNEGYIGLQNHSDKDVVYFKEVSVRPLL